MMVKGMKAPALLQLQAASEDNAFVQGAALPET